jgi:osmotically inducible protein OsmC
MSGSGRVKPASGAIEEFPVSWASRAESQHGKTSPEELLAAAHAACFSMAFANILSKAGHKVEELNTSAAVEFVPGTGITSSTISVRGRVGGLEEAEFKKLAEEAKVGCPVSKALAPSVKVTLDVRLES